MTVLEVLKADLMKESKEVGRLKALMNVDAHSFKSKFYNKMSYYNGKKDAIVIMMRQMGFSEKDVDDVLSRSREKIDYESTIWLNDSDVKY